MTTLDELGLRHGTDKASRGHNYLGHYERVLSALRQESFTLLEIGGLNGASLRMWRDYFPNANIVCIDRKPEVKEHEDERIHVEIGSAASREVLTATLDKHGAPRVVVDDGSHRWDHQRFAFKHLFPALEPGGVYIAEDIHTSYEPGFAGTDDAPFVDVLKTIVDYLNQRGDRQQAFRRRQSRGLAACLVAVDRLEFIPRACVIFKKAATAPAPAAA